MNYDQNLLIAPDISTQEKKINNPIDVNFAVVNNSSDKLGEVRNLSGELKGEVFLNSLSLDNMELVIANELRNYGFRWIIYVPYRVSSSFYGASFSINYNKSIELF